MKHKTENFNLLEEDWIPILWTNGKPDRVGIRTALTEAGHIRQIAASNPMDNVALLRLFLAALHWCTRTLGDEEHKRLCDAKGIRDDWLRELDEHQDKFCLLGDSYRFMQAPDGADNRRPVADLFHELPGATNVAHFYHIRDYRDGACIACTAIGLARLPTAITGKGAGKRRGINGDPPIYFVPIGKSLAETLLMNWRPLRHVTGDAPCWSQWPVAPGLDAPGLMEGFTWTPRQFRIDDRSMRSGHCVVCGKSTTNLVTCLYELNTPNGRSELNELRRWRDPHLAYPDDQKNLGPVDTEKNPLGASGEWRNWLKGVIQSDTEGNRAPAAIIEAARRSGKNSLRLRVVGLATRKDKSVECWERSFSIPTQFLTAEGGGKFADRTTNLNNAVAKILDPQTKAWTKAVGKLRDASLLKSLAAHDGQKLHPLRSSLADSLPALELAMFTTVKQDLAHSNGAVPPTRPTIGWDAVLDAAVLSTTFGSPLRRREATERARQALTVEIAKLGKTDQKEPEPENKKKPKSPKEDGAGSTQTEQFIRRLESLKEGERSRLRRLAGKPLDEKLEGFDLFTGLWWTLRDKSAGAPRRETSWMIAKLYGAFPMRHVRPADPVARPTLPRVLGTCEPRDEHGRPRFRTRFDSLLCSPLAALEPHLCWALSVVAEAVEKGKCSGLDWVELLDNLSIWDRGEEHRRERDVRDIWAEQYLETVHQSERSVNHAD